MQVEYWADHFEPPVLNLECYMFDPKTVKLIPEEFARRYSVIAIEKLDSEKFNILSVAMVDPSDKAIITRLEKMTKCMVTVFRAEREMVTTSINQYYMKFEAEVDVYAR